MTDTNRRTVLKLLGVAGAASAVGGAGFVTASQQDGDESTDSGTFPGSEGGLKTGGVRIGHLAPDAPPVDVFLGFDAEFDPASSSPVLAGLEYGNFEPSTTARYFEVPVGTYALKVTPADDPGTVLIDVPEFRVTNGRDFTVLAVGEAAPENDEPALEAQVIEDVEGRGNPDPSSGQAAVRFVHASPDAGAVDIVLGDETVAESVEFSAVSDYVLVENGWQVLQIQSGGSPVAVLQAYFPSGTKSTIYVIGEAAPEAAGAVADNETNVSNDTNLTNDTNVSDNVTNVTNETNDTNVTNVTNDTNATNLTNDTNVSDNLTNGTNETNATNVTGNATNLTNDTNVSDNVTNVTNDTNDTNVTGNETNVTGNATDVSGLATDDQPLSTVATVDAVSPLEVTPIDLGGDAVGGANGNATNVTNDTNVSDNLTNDTNVSDNVTNVTNETNATNNSTQ
ncbi:DUF4397 domain-containing protein [Halomarina pelagica]|uniref:DUF4397 domain-containing protein n=1 Tax=Halomarina pelagica TaxID=2961599 RepID=UPI0020C3DBF1|nr:DUF4397 domain-containing protein [Halomarina sp. BND7]